MISSDFGAPKARRARRNSQKQLLARNSVMERERDKIATEVTGQPNGSDGLGVWAGYGQGYRGWD
jgi:hypothetical protein